MRLPRAVLYMAASAFGFSAMAMFVKLADRHLPTGEIVFSRAVVTLILSYWMVVRAGLYPWGTNKRGLMFRGFVGFAGLSTYFLSLAHLPLADATVIQQTVPVITAVIAWFVLKEAIGWSTLFAIVCGVAGVALVVRPSGGGLDTFGVVVGIAAAVISSTAYVTVRQLSRTEHPYVIVFYFPLIATPLNLPWAVATWVTPSAVDWLLLLAIGVTTQIGQVFITKALAIESAGKVTSLGYLQIAFAIAWQWTVFGDAPTLWTIGGAALIVIGTLAVTGSGESPSHTPTSPDTPG